MRGKMDCHGLTDIGRVRKVNEDQFLIADLNKSMLVRQTSLDQDDHTRLFSGSQGQLLLVADGMGGHTGGHQASTLAVQALERYMLDTMPWFFRLEAGQEADLKEELKATLEECQRRIQTVAATDPVRQRMGTTLTMAYLLWPRLYVVHAGDSRCYVLRRGRLNQITVDHTMAQQLVERGALSAQEAEASRWSHVLWNCVGGGTAELNVDVYKATLEVGDTLLLCTDGLTNRLSNEQIIGILQERSSAAETCRRLVDLANEQGGQDNITVVVAHLRDYHEALTQQAAAGATAMPDAVVQRPAQAAEAAS